MFLAFSILCQQANLSLFLLKLNSLASKSVFAIKNSCANLALITSAAKVLNSGVVIYLSQT